MQFMRTLQPMHAFLHRPFLSNTPLDFLILLGLMLLVFVFRFLFARIVLHSLFQFMRHWFPQLAKKDLVRLMLKPMALFLVTMTFVAYVDHFVFPKTLDFRIHFLGTSFSSILGSLKMALLLVSFVWILLRAIDVLALAIAEGREVHPSASNRQLVYFLRDFAKIILTLLGLVFMLKFLVGGEWVGRMIGALGIGAAALALAAKESIENLIGSFIILMDKPFVMGDYIVLNNVSGVIEKVGLRSTRLRTDNRTYVTIPNKLIVDSILDNQTLQTQRRILLNLELSGDTPSESMILVLQDIRQLLQSNEFILPGFTLNLNDIRKHSLVIQLFCYTPVTDWAAYTGLRQQLVLDIVKILEGRQVRLASEINLQADTDIRKQV